MAGILKHYTGNSTAVNTTDNTTVTTIHTFTPASYPGAVNNCVLQVTGTLIGKNNADGAQGVSISASATFTIVSGTVALVGSQTSLLAAQGSAGLLTSVLTLDASSNVIRLRATGIVGTIIWTGWLEIKTTTLG